MLESLAVALAGGLIAFVLATLLTTLMAAWTRRVQARSPQSLVTPVLAFDALAPDLRALYARSLNLEAHTGRELRRLLLIGQAASVAGRLDLDDVIGPLERLLEEAEGCEGEPGQVRQRARILRSEWEGSLDEAREAAQK